MELGNLFFGVSRGEYEVPRHKGYEKELYRLFHRLGNTDVTYPNDFTNDVFEIHPYYWGDCTCGYEEKKLKWEKLHQHSPNCPWRGYSYKLPLPDPCRCGYVHELEMFEAENDHTDDCLLLRPNFWFKPTGYKLKFYKYPLRDSYASQKLSLAKFGQMIDECIKSLGENHGDHKDS